MVRATGTDVSPGGALRYRGFVRDAAQGGKMAITIVHVDWDENT